MVSSDSGINGGDGDLCMSVGSRDGDSKYRDIENMRER